MDKWHPRATRVIPDSGTDGGGAFVAGYSWRQEVHTTEGGPNYSPSSASFFGNQYWPHATIGRVNGVARITQHLPIDRAARASENDSGGVETNKAYNVQVEVCWWASKAKDLPEDIRACLEDWLRWVASQTGSKLTGPTFYGPDCGWTLASETAPQRMTFAQWTSFNGVCGHQHVPENVHWDPGALNLAWVLNNQAPPAPVPPAQEYIDVNLTRVPFRVKLSNSRGYTDVDFDLYETVGDPEFYGGDPSDGWDAPPLIEKPYKVGLVPGTTRIVVTKSSVVSGFIDGAIWVMS